MAVAPGHLLHFFTREGVELLDAHQRDIVNFILPGLSGKVEIDLSGAQNQALDLFRVGLRRVVDDQLEAAVGQVVQRRCRLLEPQQRSEEYTSELQSRGHLVCRLLLEKKK